MIPRHVGKLSLALTALSAVLIWHFRPLPARPQPPSPTVTAPPLHQWFTSVTAGVPPKTHDDKPLTLSEQLDQLLSTRDPADAFKAYHVIKDCMTFLRIGNIYTALPGRPGADDMLAGLSEDGKASAKLRCSGLTQRIRMTRLDYLAAAAQAKVVGADLAFFAEGPFGDRSALTSRPDDLLVKQWKQQAVAHMTTAANEGNEKTLFLLMLLYLQGGNVFDKDMQLALTYKLALQQIEVRDSFSDQYFVNDHSLTADQIAAARKAADEIIATHARHHPKPQ